MRGSADLDRPTLPFWAQPDRLTGHAQHVAILSTASRFAVALAPTTHFPKNVRTVPKHARSAHAREVPAAVTFFNQAVIRSDNRKVRCNIYNYAADTGLRHLATKHL